MLANFYEKFWTKRKPLWISRNVFSNVTQTTVQNHTLEEDLTNNNRYTTLFLCLSVNFCERYLSEWRKEAFTYSRNFNSREIELQVLGEKTNGWFFTLRRQYHETARVLELFSDVKRNSSPCRETHKQVLKPKTSSLCDGRTTTG